MFKPVVQEKPYFVLISGVSGVGKTTLAKKVMALGEISGRQLHYHDANEHKKIIRENYFATKKKLHQLDQHETMVLNRAMFTSLFRTEKPGIHLIDTYLTYPSGENFVRLTPPDIAGRLDGCILLFHDYEVIALRRGTIYEMTTKQWTQLRREVLAEDAESSSIELVYGMPTTQLQAGDDKDHIKSAVSFIQECVVNKPLVEELYK